MAEPVDYPARLRAALAAMQKQQATIDRLEQEKSDPIAVIGLGCRFPGGANDAESFWHLLRDGVDAIREVPADRWAVADHFDATPGTPGKMATRWGGFLDEVDRFDARFFRISPREAVAMDPQQRLLLEVSWEALENAAVDPATLSGSQTGVFVGLTTLDYAKVIYRDDFTKLDAYCATGNVANVASGRLSYFYGLRGPSLTVDTACSSSLVAVHLACQSLRSGESRLALAAGVNLILAPDGSIAVSQAQMLSPDGRCKTFDRSADGYARAEGCGLVVLKRLSAALEDGDRVLAVIRGSAVRQDGARSGLTVPNGPAQEAVMRAALDAARVTPAEVGLIEAHGTGTSLGDPIEVEAIGNVFGGRPASRPLVIGALKTNIGHMESAAGVGGIIKTVLALQHGEIPRHLHLRTVSPDIDLAGIPAIIPTRHLPWPAGYERRIAGVSSFGSSGTVAHVILEAPDRWVQEVADGVADGQPHLLPRLLRLSAATPAALEELCDRYERFLSSSRESFADICHTATIGRAQFPCRAEVIATDRAGAVEQLRARRREPAPRPPAPVTTRDVEGGSARRVSLPTYPFQRERYWPGQPAGAPPAAIAVASTGLRLGIMFFNGTEAPEPSENYRLLIDAARFADANGLSSVWLPERHFTSFGSLYPNPATLHAAIARETSRVRLMAGSVVMPLHHPLRVAEEWAVVDNLSGGRVGMSFASGWNPDDFALNPEQYATRQEALFRGIEDVRRLWRGEAIDAVSGRGESVRLRTYPAPIQRDLPLWVTAASNPRTFERAGAIGANVLTHLLDHDVDELANKIALYRAAREANGHDAGSVTVMLHTFLGDSLDEVHAKVRAPYCQYLKENIHLLKGLAFNRGSQADVSTLSGADLDAFVSFLYDRFFSTRALLGTVDSCRPLLESLAAAGVNEIACLLDFGPATDDVLAALPGIRVLAEHAAALTVVATTAAPPPDASLLDHAYEIRWVEAAAGAPKPPQRALILAETLTDEGGVAALLAAELGAAGWRATVSAAATASVEDVGRADAVIDLRCLSRQPAADPTPGLIDALALIRTAIEANTLNSSNTAKLWFITRGAAQVTGAERPAPAHAALAGLARVLPIEHPRLWGGLIDLDPRQADAATIGRQLAHALTTDSGEDQIAIRDGRLLGARLSRVDRVQDAAPWRCDPDATCLVTGGLRGLGLEAARWLADAGATRLVLAGRTPGDAAGDTPTAQVVDELRRRGLEVETVALDVTDRAAVTAFVDARQAVSKPPVRIVVHAAGLWRDRPLAELSAPDLAAVLAPKVAGAMNLIESLPGLDTFIAFSAFSAILPAATQGNYAAANAYLDALMKAQVKGASRRMSVNWGPWSDVGFAMTEYGARAHRRLESLGITRITPAAGFDALSGLMASGATGLGVMPVDWTLLFERDPNARLSPLLSDLHRQFGAPPNFSSPSLTTAAGASAQRLLDLRPAEQIAGLERELTAMTAAIVRLRPAEIGRLVSFTDLGVDSLMAVELKNRIQHDLGVDVPLVTLLGGPTIADLTVTILAQLKMTQLVDRASASGDLTEIEI